MRTSLLIIVVLSIVLAPKIFAQNAKVAKLVKKGHKYYNKFHFDKARQLYTEALKIDSNDVEANLYVGIDFLKTDHKWKALSYIKKAYSSNRNVSDQIDFYLGVAYQYNYQFTQALFYLEKAQKDHHSYNGEEWKEIYFRIEQCKNSIKLKENNREFRVVNMGTEVNSPFRDYAPVINPMQDKIIFASNRREGKDKEHPEGKYFMDIYVVNKEGNEWNQARKMDKFLKTSYDDMGLSFDSEGKKLLIYKTQNFGDIFISELAGGQWKKPENLGSNINTSEYTEISACMSTDGNTLLFTSNRPGGSGGMDIYISSRDENGSWKKAENIGSSINTAGDEEGPFLSPDGKMLFFSSDGHPGIGGLDILYSKLDEKTGEWGKPQNMGFPVNSPEDDINFVLSNDGLTGYYTSIRTDTYGGEDIYKVTMSQPEPEGPSLLASIYNAAPDDLTGQDDYISTSENYLSDKRDRKGYKVDTYTAFASNSRYGEPAGVYKDVLLQNVYFDLMKAELNSDAYEYLDRVAAFMIENDGIKLELAGHTDDTGSKLFNLNLSWRRAESVFQYLKGKGIKPSRMSMKGYGKAKPLATNDDENEGRELNRRVEFNILPNYDDYSITDSNSYGGAFN